MHKPPSGWPSVVLVALMLLTVAWAIQEAEYAAGLYILTPLVIGGVIAGVVLGGQRWLPATLAHGWSVLAGILATALLGTGTLELYLSDLSDLPQSTLEQMLVVRDWYVSWAATAAGGTFSRDDPVVPFAFVLTMGFLLWLLAYISTWFVVRYLSWWGAVMPAGFALLFNLYQAPEERLSAMAFFLACALLLGQQLHAALQIDQWRRQRVGFGGDIGLELLRDGVVVVLVVIGAAWLAPTQLESDRLRSAMASMTSGSRQFEQRFNNLFPDLNYPARGGGSDFGTSLPLGGSIQLGDRAIFDARVGTEIEAPRYFRMAVFDVYRGDGWSRTVDETAEGNGLDLALVPPVESTEPVTQTIRTYLATTRQLAALPQPDRFALPVTVEYIGRGPNREAVAVESRPPLGVGEAYVAVSQQSQAGPAQLAASSGPDPEWIGDRYLDVPSTVPARVSALALELVAPAADRFDASTRIESFLRENYRYSETIATPPADQDRVDWFLFDERQGYCDYYASSFVILARAAGIPSRLAAGYSRGEYVTDASAYRQHEADAHTWPEVYFPRYGWIEFEPTAGDAPLDRGDASDQAQPTSTPDAGEPYEDFMPPDERDVPPPDLGEASATGGAAGFPARGGAALLVVLLSTLLGALAATIWWARPYRGLTMAQGAFARLGRAAAWFGIGPAATETPSEYGRRLGEAIPEGRGDIATIIDAYVRERFGRQASDRLAEPLGRAWVRLRALLTRAAARLALRRARRR